MKSSGLSTTLSGFGDTIMDHANPTVSPRSLSGADIVLITVVSIVGCIGVCANIWMIWSLCKTWIKGSRFHFFLLALCLTDAVGLAINCIIDIRSYSPSGYQEYGCKLASVFRLFGVCLNHLILAGFNIDNVITAICRRPRRVLRIVILLLCVVLALGANVPQFLAAKLFRLSHGETICLMNVSILPDMAIFWVPVSIVFLFGLPALILTCNQRGDNNSEKTSLVGDNNDESLDINRDVGLVTVYNVLFIICWTPGSLFQSIMHYQSKVWENQWFPIIFLVLNILMLCNSFLNPLAYKIFTCIHNRRKKPSAGL